MSKDLTALKARERMRSLADPCHAETLQWFFKTGPGGYGEGDRFLGLRVPQTRKVAREFSAASHDVAFELLDSEVHEERLLALLILAEKFRTGDDVEQAVIVKHYLESTHRVNNWDLVDSSAHLILGPWLQNRDRSVLWTLARSDSLWERRIAMIATLHFIRRCEFDDAFAIAGMLIGDSEDLIHKACGWMLREIGNRDGVALRRFLKANTQRMPRTMLRYAIEKFPPAERAEWMAVPREELVRGKPRLRKT